MASQLIKILAAARAAGFEAHHMTALPEVVYRLHFWMTNATTGGPEAKAARPDADRVAETKVGGSHGAEPSKDFGQWRGLLRLNQLPKHTPPALGSPPER